jgi:hypothetical protein
MSASVRKSASAAYFRTRCRENITQFLNYPLQDLRLFARRQRRQQFLKIAQTRHGMQFNSLLAGQYCQLTADTRNSVPTSAKFSISSKITTFEGTTVSD